MDKKECKIVRKWMSVVCAKGKVDYEHELSLESINRSYINDSKWLEKSFRCFRELEMILEKDGLRLNLVLSILLSDLQTTEQSEIFKKSELSGCLLDHLPSFSLLPEFQFKKILEIGKFLDSELSLAELSYRVIEWEDSENSRVIHRAIYFFRKT